jgi:hypothetical protein
LLGLASIGALHVVSTVLDKLGKPNPISSPLAEVLLPVIMHIFLEMRR